jgi:hypothetical protein
MKKITIENTHFGTHPFAFHYHGDKRHSCRNPSFVELFLTWERRSIVWDTLSENDKLSQGFWHDRKMVPTKYPFLPKGATHPINEKLHTFTISNLGDRWLGAGRATMDYFGMEYDLIGRDMPHPYTHDMKIPELINHIPTIEKPYTMFFDSGDIVFTSPPDQLLNNFESDFKDASMVCNADGWSYPINSPTEDWELNIAEDYSPKSPYRFLNSGLWIATTKFIQEEFLPLLIEYRKAWDLKVIKFKKLNKDPLLEGFDEPPYTDCDQGIFKHIYQDLYPKIKLDHNCKYFQSLAWDKNSPKGFGPGPGGARLDEYYPGTNNLKFIGSEEI